MADTPYQTGKSEANALYAASSAAVANKSAGADQVSKGTGQFVDTKASAPAQTSSESLGEAAARAKKDKAAAPKKAAKVIGEFSKGGKVKKTGIYKLHAKERVLNPSQTKKAEKMSGMKSVLSGKC